MKNNRILETSITQLLDFLLPDRTNRNKWQTSTHWARLHIQNYVRTTRYLPKYKIKHIDFIKALRANGFHANWLSCNISSFDMKLIEAANTIRVDNNAILTRMKEDPIFIPFLADCIRVTLENEKSNLNIRVLFDDLKWHDAFFYGGNYYSISLYSNMLLIRDVTSIFSNTNKPTEALQ